MDNPSLTQVLNESVALLELPAVLEEAARHAVSVSGREHVLSTAPEDDPEVIERLLRLVMELKEMVGLHGPLGLHEMVPMSATLSRVLNPATVLDAEELLAVGDLVSRACVVKERLEALDGRFEVLREEAERIILLDQLRNRIRSVFDEHGAVRSTASPGLIALHNRMRGARDRIRKRLEDVVRDRDLARVVQEDYVTLRNDRYVILLRPEFKGLLDGIVHDHSRSGSSVYVEPLNVVDNEVASLSDEEREEIRRIFKELTETVRDAHDELAEDFSILTRLDAFQARAVYAEVTASTSPELSTEGFRIFGARHPLLLATDEVSVVPMDVIQEGSTVAVVISGPNMGGKTVALKIAGLFPLMIRCGLMIPAREGTRINPFAAIMADIGDEQDLRGRVSSFSGHMVKIKAILENVSAGDLVLLDELGGATDPEEGSALAMAVVDELIRRQARIVVTTHLTQLKAYAMSRDDVKNVSVEFHPVTLKPTFRLLYDLPGESHAIEAAEQIGVPLDVIAAAKRYLDRWAGGSSRLLSELRQKMAEVEESRISIDARERTLEGELSKLRQERDDIVEEFRKGFRDMMRRAEKQIADIQHSLKSGRITRKSEPRETLGRIRDEVVEKLGTPLEKEVPLPDVGATVRVSSLGKEGVVTAVLDKRRVEVAVGGMTVRADAEDLVLPDRWSPKKNPSKKDGIAVDIPLATPRWEVNVIGLRVDEAVPIVERALDNALLGGLATISVIHGKGTGRLRKGIREYLAGHSLVRDFHTGDFHGGGDGVTVVHLVSE
jgi:DNA mismatch repair protein MutS2